MATTGNKNTKNGKAGGSKANGDLGRVLNAGIRAAGKRGKKSGKGGTFLALIVAILIIVAAYLIKPWDYLGNDIGGGTAVTEGALCVRFIDIGQGDAVLFSFPTGENMLVDTGDKDSENRLVAYLKSLSVKNIDYLILTHPDSDHIGESVEILSNFDVANVYMTSRTSTTKLYSNLITKIDDLGLEINVPERGETLKIGEGMITFLSPSENDRYSDNNNSSIVFRLAYGNNSFMMTGDAETAAESYILSDCRGLKSDILKCGHHGSSSSTSDAFLSAVSPDYAIISCGEGNSYGHPHKETVAKLNENGISIYRTDTMGTVTVVTDGEKLTFTTEK